MNIQEKFINKENFVYKFSDAPKTNNVLNPGWATPTFDDFLTRVVRDPVLLNQSAVIPMTSLEHNLDMLNKEPDFESQRNLSTGVSYGYSDLTDIGPDKTQKTLLAKPLALKSVITQNFLDENIEKEGFLDTWTSYLAAQAGPALERFGVFSDTASSQSTVASGLKATDGILKQCLTINGGAQAKTTGTGNLVYQNEVADGIFRNINRYVANDGDLDNATLVLPPQIYSRFMAETSADRDTPLGDIIWENGKTPKVMGIEIKADHVLRNSPNGYSSLKFDANGEYDSDGTDKTNMLYGFLSKPSNNVFGIMRDTEVKQEYSIDVLGYKTALLAKADAKVLFEQDTLAIPFTLTNKSN